MDKILNILHLEDSVTDAELVERELKKGEISFIRRVVSTKEEYVQALRDFSPDIILSDHSLPAFNSIGALQLLKESNIGIPFILVTATVSEEFAVEMMKHGAADFILKDRLQRLPAAVIQSIDNERSKRERMKAREELTSAHNRLLFHLENAPLGYIEWDNELRVKTWSKRAEDIFGWTESELTIDAFDWDKQIYEGDKVITANILEQLMSGEVESNTVQHRNYKKDGTIIWCEWFNSVLTNDEGKVITIMSLVQDITEKKNAEIERARITSDLITRNKDLEQFAYIVSHNLRAPVANVIGIASILQMPDIDIEERRQMTDGLAISVANLDNVVKDLNNVLQTKYEMRDKKKMVTFSGLLNEVRLGISDMIKSEDVTLISDFSEVDNLFTLKNYLYSIFFNLISNSIKYRQTDLKPIIEVRSKMVDKKVQLSFKDNGLGIDLKRRGDQVFGLYKRFHLDIEGKGMGLYMVKMQVELLEGKISVESQVNKGTEFLIEFDI